MLFYKRKVEGKWKEGGKEERKLRKEEGNKEGVRKQVGSEDGKGKIQQRETTVACQ